MDPVAGLTTGLNVVRNSAPGQAAAQYVDSLPLTLNQTQVKPPPGGVGVQTTNIKSQLVQGNPGGIGAASGLGISIDSGA
jgi:hypothetical protein